MKTSIRSSLFFFLFLLINVTFAQNPICPIGTYIADPTARVWQDGKLYIYGSTDESVTEYCSSIDEVEMTSQGAGQPLSAFHKIEAERACLLSGYCRISRIEKNNEAITEIKSGDGAVYKYIDFGKGVTKLTSRISPYCGGKIILRKGSVNGEVIAEINVLNSEGLKEYQEYTTGVNNLNGTHALYIEFQGSERGSKLFDLDWIKFK